MADSLLIALAAVFSFILASATCQYLRARRFALTSIPSPGRVLETTRPRPVVIGHEQVMHQRCYRIRAYGSKDAHAALLRASPPRLYDDLLHAAVAVRSGFTLTEIGPELFEAIVTYHPRAHHQCTTRGGDYCCKCGKPASTFLGLDRRMGITVPEGWRPQSLLRLGITVPEGWRPQSLRPPATTDPK